MERYRTIRREGVVSMISKAITASGGRIIRDADPSLAPFEFLVETPSREILDLVCYAFTANKYRQGGRPADEHRFQVKYGSDFDRYHELFIDDAGKRTTLMFGAHLEEGIFVAVDPRMHTPTWFSSSVEFKDAQVRAARRSGWTGWHRERSENRRKRVMPALSEFDLRTETVIAFRPENFLRYAAFEHLVGGLDAGERLRASDTIERDLASGKGNLLVASEGGANTHPLETLLGLSAREVLDVIGGAFRLMAAVRGSVAEHHLGVLLQQVPGVSDLEHVDRDGQPDFKLTYRRKRLSIECKNVLARKVRDLPKVDFQRTRHAKDDPCHRYYARDEFDVVAACLHPITGKWEFQFCPVSKLPDHDHCRGRVSQHVLVSGADWTSQIRRVLDEVTS